MIPEQEEDTLLNEIFKLFRTGSSFQANPQGWPFIFSLIRFTPDDYKREPELFLANGAGHIGLGVWLAMAVCGLWLLMAGEFPRREGIWVVIAVGYMAWEMVRQGWRGKDTISDWVFVALYGSGGALYCFKEVVRGSDVVTASLFDILIVSIAPITHLIIGAVIRALRRARAEGVTQNV